MSLLPPSTAPSFASPIGATTGSFGCYHSASPSHQGCSPGALPPHLPHYSQKA